ALYASLKRFHQLWNKSGVDFAAYVAFYPDCATTFRDDTDLVAKPVRIFGGAPDDYNPIALCKAYAERLKAAGVRDLELTEHPHAPPPFDNPPLKPVAIASPRSQSVRNCRIREAAVGTLINGDTGQAFDYTDACVTLGPHLGGDAEATQQAKQAVTAFLRG